MAKTSRAQAKKIAEQMLKGNNSKKEDARNIIRDRITQVYAYNKENPFFYDKHRMWWKWKQRECRWIRCDEVDILSDIYNGGGEIVESKERSEILNAMKHVGRDKQPKEIEKVWIQYKNKLHNIETNNVAEATPDSFVTNPIPHKLGESEETPTIDELFDSWVGNEHREELYEILAFSQAPVYFIQRIICLIGSGANGKSTYLSLMRKYLGEDNVVTSSLENLMKVRFESSKLYRKLICLMGETNFGTISKTDFIKSLSGEDKVRFEFKGKDSFDDVNYAKLIIATNSLPMTTDKTEGFYRRWKILNFVGKFGKEKDVLSEIPKVEYENLSLKCFNILRKLWENRVFTNDKNFDDRRKEYEKYSNPLMLFIEKEYEKDVNSEILTEDFREEFEVFLSDNGFRTQTPKEVTTHLKDNGFEVRQLTKIIDKNTIRRKFIIGLKKKNVSLVSNVSHNSIQSLIGDEYISSDTSGISDTEIEVPSVKYLMEEQKLSYLDAINYRKGMLKSMKGGNNDDIR